MSIIEKIKANPKCKKLKEKREFKKMPPINERQKYKKIFEAVIYKF
ncbi:MAG TPA: hypothetical protein VJ378_01270 [Candidatus Paceibacterota bacterium]|nr:hypothetical protein [Candidatus Paceibacterota bacterium]